MVLTGQRISHLLGLEGQVLALHVGIEVHLIVLDEPAFLALELAF